MKKQTTKRLGLEMIQHLFAAGIMIIIAAIVFNSYVAVDSMSGTKTYMVNSLGSKQVFEDSELFQNIFETAVSDITRLVVSKEQLETDGIFDPSKKIDVTEYAGRKGDGNGCPITAVYELDDLIKWGKYGVDFNNRVMSMSDFVNYFGSIDNAANFALDEYGNLYFRGFIETSENMHLTKKEETSEDAEKLAAEKQKISQVMQKYTEEQLEDMAFSYIITKIPEGINMFREEDGTLNVNFSVLNCRYESVNGERQLLSYADNWVDYMKLQNNLVETINSLTTNYKLYSACNGLYLENSSNLKYAVRMMTADGIRTYTNVSELLDAKESEITDYFGEYRQYFIYYPDSLEFSGNTKLTEDEIYTYMRQYEYAYPETTHIWIGVDTTYPIKGDAFYSANEVFGKIVPHREFFIGALAILIFGWIGICIYLTVIAGIGYKEDGKTVKYLNPFDHLWTEVMFVLAVGAVYAAYRGFSRLMDVANEVYLMHSESVSVLGTSWMYRYGIFALYGLVVSMVFDLFWFSLVRRLRGKNLWRCSFTCWLFSKIQQGIRFVLLHSSTAVSTLIPYNFYLLVNLIGIFVIYIFRERSLYVLIALAVLVIFDGIIGVVLFKSTAEKMDIVEGIRKIRDGEVDYKLDTDSLHGVYREMADAVNNIGEGIHKAVKTSMKDEQMKTDLITNVSHDLKTPLTSIISYVDLLKRLKIEEEPAKSYIEILEGKSQRLKQLSDDLVEASKISSGNIELQKEKLDLAELLNQSIGEFSDKLGSRQLQTVFETNHSPACIFADSRRMWRIIENLFNNICKYAMENTRVYIDLTVAEGKVELSVKNISERQMNMKGEDLTERFIRGDESRTTEGTGLGLSIAKSLTEVQGGTFTILLDGDLFKVVLVFPEYVEPEKAVVESTEVQDRKIQGVKVQEEKAQGEAEGQNYS